METFIKYQRIDKAIPFDSLQDFFDDLIINGWTIISYAEKEVDMPLMIRIILLVGKQQRNL